MLPGSFFILLQSNIVQTYLGHKISTYLSEKYHTEISIGQVDVRFFMDVVLKNVYVADNHKNALLKSDKIQLDLDDFSLATNYVSINKLSFDNTYFNLRRYKNEDKTNLQNFVALFGSDTSSSKKHYEYPLKIKIKQLSFENSGFSYVNENRSHNNNETIDFDDISINKLHIDMQDVAIIKDSIAANIKSLTLSDKCGFTLSMFSGYAHVSQRNIIVDNLRIITPNSNLDLDLKFAYQSFDDFDDFVNQIEMTSTIRKTALNFLDIAHFAKELSGMNDKILFSSDVKGKVNNLKIKNFKMRYGNNTVLDADIAMNGLPNIEETYSNIKIRNLSTSVRDINSIIIPLPERRTMTLTLPDILKRLGNVNVKGIFTGFYSNFVAKAAIKTDVGNASSDIIVGNSDKILTYNGKIKTENFNLGLFTSASDLLGKVSIDAQIIGSGFTYKTASFKVNGKMDLFEFKKYNYTNIELNGGLDKMVYTGLIDILDNNLKMHFDGLLNLNDSLAASNFTAKIAYANLKNLKLLPKDSISEFSGELKTDFKGSNIDNLEGNIFVDKAHFTQNKKVFTLNSLMLETHINNTGYRTFDLKSDYVDAIFKGYFVFKELPTSFKRFVLTYLPSFNFKIDSTAPYNPRQEFEFVIKLYNATPVVRYFIPDAKISGNTTIRGNFNSINNTTLIDAISSDMTFYGKKLANCKIDIKGTPETINLTLHADSLKLSDSTWLPDFNFATHELNDSLLTSIRWNNSKTNNHSSADINLFTYFYPNAQSIIDFKKSTLTIDDSVWLFNTQGNVRFDSTGIAFNKIGLYRNAQNISINGNISKNPLAVFSVKFENFDVSNFDGIMNAQDFDLDGIITGSLFISDMYGKTNYYSDVKIKDFGFNGDKIGDAIILSKWDSKNKGIKINADVDYVVNSEIVKPLFVTGYYYPSNEAQNFDLDISATNLHLKTLSRYISSFGTINGGTATGKIKLTGTNANPQLLGNMKVSGAFLHINYLNTTYSFDYDSVKITNSEFSFKNIKVNDPPYSNSAVVNGKITHTNFKNLGIDIYVVPKKTFCLNTNPSLNEMFYGKAFATGNMHIYGTPLQLKMDIIAKTEKGTQLSIPIGGTASLATNEYITFVNNSMKMTEEDQKGKQLSGVDVDMLMNVTDDAEIQIMFDPKAGDRIKGKGNGNLRMTVNPDGHLGLFGDYVISSGDYLFTFQNIINKRFIIDEGGTIKWNGDPYNADLDITARYKLKANLGSLGVSIGDSNRTVSVECIIKIKDILSSPNYTFEVDFPALTDFEKGPYVSAINQNINNNFLSLLVINSFVNSGSGVAQSGLSNATFLGKSASEVLSNQLSNWLSQISKSIDIGVNYRPGDNISQEEVEVALSTQLFNERVNIESNLGVNTGYSSNKNSNQIIGDVNIEVKITKALKFRVFNRTNQYDVLQFVAPYTQGLGITYRKEFAPRKKKTKE